MKVKFETINEECEVVSLKEVLTEEEYRRAVRFANSDLAAEHVCHKNAFLFCNCMRDIDCEYVEGLLYYGTMPHSFNRIRGKYVDITSELVNGTFKPGKKVYVKRVFKLSEIFKVFKDKMQCFVTFSGYRNSVGKLLFFYDNSGQKVLVNNRFTEEKYMRECNYVNYVHC